MILEKFTTDKLDVSLRYKDILTDNLDTSYVMKIV